MVKLSGIQLRSRFWLAFPGIGHTFLVSGGQPASRVRWKPVARHSREMTVNQWCSRCQYWAMEFIVAKLI